MSNIQKIINKKPSNKKWWIISIVIILIVIGSYFTFHTKKQKTKNYITKLVTIGDINTTVSETGNINPTDTVDIGTDISGKVTKIFVDYNSIVKKGDVLATIDDVKYKIAKNQAEANLKSAKANLNKAKINLKIAQIKLKNSKNNFQRDEKLRKATNNRTPSQKVFDDDKTLYLTSLENIKVANEEIKSAKEAIKVAQENLNLAIYNLSKTKIYSPVDGIVLNKNVKVGQTVVASFQTPTLFKIAENLTKMQLEVSIDENDIAKVKVNDIVRFSVDAYENKSFNGKISQIRLAPQNINGVVTYNAIVDVNNSNLLLKPGMSANIDIITQTLKNVKIIPRAALLYNPKKDNTIYILKNNKTTEIKVKILGFSNEKCAVKSDKIEANQKVIIAEKR